MATIRRAPNEQELDRLRRIFLKAETDIINEIARLRSRGLVDYHALAALERVQRILLEMQDECWKYAPRMIERYFYANHPELRAGGRESVRKHLAGYENASALSMTEVDVVQRLTVNLMGEIEEASATVVQSLADAMLGRQESGIFRRVGLETVISYQAQGRTLQESVKGFVDTVEREGVTAFTDRAGRNWSLHTYGNMVCRTTSRQAQVLSVLERDRGQDLFKITSVGSTCPLCAPLEGRVYSKSGRDPDFPALAYAYGQINPNGAWTLENSWLNIHPNCLHALVPWTAAGRTEKEIEEIKRFSSFRTNPPTVDPRTEQQIAAYREKERARARYLEDYKQFERYRLAIPDAVPKTFQTFERHKRAGDDQYKEWQRLYRKASREGV